MEPGGIEPPASTRRGTLPSMVRAARSTLIVPNPPFSTTTLRHFFQIFTRPDADGVRRRQTEHRRLDQQRFSLAGFRGLGGINDDVRRPVENPVERSDRVHHRTHRLDAALVVDGKLAEVRVPHGLGDRERVGAGGQSSRRHRLTEAVPLHAGTVVCDAHDSPSGTANSVRDRGAERALRA